MPASLENSSVATGLEKVSFHSNPKERKCQRMFKLPHNCIHFTHQQSNAENSPSQASIVRELRIPDVPAGFRKGRGTRDQIANIHWNIEKAREFQKNIYFCFTFCHKSGIICVSEVIDSSPSNLDSSLCFIQPDIFMMYSAFKLNKQSDSIYP